MDDHLPPLAADRLEPDAVRRRFATNMPWQPELPGDALPYRDPAGTRAAAVLVPLVMRADGLTVLLTQRTAHLRDHAGQISFPGGGAEPSDADHVATALREAHEEIGLPASQVEVLGHLPPYVTITRYSVTPVVALVQPGFRLALDPFEVAEAFEVPMSFLMTPAHHRRHATDIAGTRRHFLSMPWQATSADGTRREYFIWGATASMLRNLYGYLAV
ncbi:MAG: CoA pyrophosphatase [Aquabacterium sp.]